MAYIQLSNEVNIMAIIAVFMIYISGSQPLGHDPLGGHNAFIGGREPSWVSHLKSL